MHGGPGIRSAGLVREAKARRAKEVMIEKREQEEIEVASVKKAGDHPAFFIRRGTARRRSGCRGAAGTAPQERKEALAVHRDAGAVAGRTKFGPA